MFGTSLLSLNSFREVNSGRRRVCLVSVGELSILDSKVGPVERSIVKHLFFISLLHFFKKWCPG